MPDNALCNIVLFNDDETPMDFVVHVLQEFLDLDFDEANKRMLRVHHEGKAICGTYEREEAETRLTAIIALAAKHNHPLKCILEEAR
jgi:ATP-dependent Clp protease adaptor protein ClpS